MVRLFLVVLFLCVLLACALASKSDSIEEASKLEATKVAAAAVAAEGASAAEGGGKKKKEKKPKVSTKPPKGKKRNTKDWSKVKMNDLEKEWEEGDDEEEREHEYEHSQKVAKKMKDKIKGPRFDPSNPESLKAAMKDDPIAFTSLASNSAPSMVFIELHKKQSDGSDWDKPAMDKLAAKWGALMKTAHLQANVFNLGESTGDNQLLVSMDKGWQSNDILKFILTQPETFKLSRDNKDVFASEYQERLEDDDDEL